MSHGGPGVPATDEFPPARRSFALNYGGYSRKTIFVCISLGNGGSSSGPRTPSRPQAANVEHGSSAALRV